MTPTQIDYLRDFAINHLPRAQATREQIRRYGGDDLYSQLAHTTVMVRGNAGTTAIEYAAASVLESVSLLQLTLKTKERADTLHNLTSAANALCLHTGTNIEWLAVAAPEPEPEQSDPPPAKHLPSIAGQWLSTKAAAEFLGFKEQTLRQWASTQSAPTGLIGDNSPKKVGRRLKWSGDSILVVLTKPN